MIRVFTLGMGLALAGCAQLGLAPQTPLSSSEGQLRPQARPGGEAIAMRVPPETARTVEDFDTTTQQEREAASAPVQVAGERLLGTTIVSLGDPARPGFWVETPLVSSTTTGRVEFAATGKSSRVDLIPIDGPATAGSRMSLATMRLIGVPLTGLAEVQVFSGG